MPLLTLPLALILAQLMPPPTPSPAGPMLVPSFASPGDYFEIDNSGSSNTLGYRIFVRRDGSALTFMVPSTGAVDFAHGEKATVEKSSAEAVFADLAGLTPFPPAGGAPCMHSVSFGSTTTVVWKGRRSPSLECPGSPAYAALRRDVMAVAGQLRLATMRRRQLPPAGLPGALPQASP